MASALNGMQSLHTDHAATLPKQINSPVRIADMSHRRTAVSKLTYILGSLQVEAQLYDDLKRCVENGTGVTPMIYEQRMAFISTIALTGSILTGVVATCYSWPGVEEAPWPVRAFWIAAIFWSLLCVQSCIMAVGHMHSSLQTACDQIAAGLSPRDVLLPFCLQPTLSWFAALLYCIGMAIYVCYPLADGEWGREQKFAATTGVLIVGILLPYLWFIYFPYATSVRPATNVWRYVDDTLPTTSEQPSTSSLEQQQTYSPHTHGDIPMTHTPDYRQ